MTAVETAVFEAAHPELGSANLTERNNDVR
jgi:hypothetical protein